MPAPTDPAVASPSSANCSRIPRVLVARRFWWGCLVCWAVVLFVLSEMPGRDGPSLPTHTDKVAHFLYFACGGAALGALWALRRTAGSLPMLLVVAALAGGAVGLLDEWHQTFTPDRSGLSPGDWLADVLGTLTGAAAMFALVGKALVPHPRRHG